MKATEFCYWLQGAFEITGIEVLDRAKLECVRKHLRLVEAQKRDDSPAMALTFYGWLSGALDITEAVESNRHSVPKIREKLDAVFEHAIDKAYPNGEELNCIHNGGRPNASGMRC